MGGFERMDLIADARQVPGKSSLDLRRTAEGSAAGRSALTVADAEAYGSRWLISLEADMRKGLSAGNSEALASWKKISEALAFFEQHKAWRAYEPVAKLGILSDFAGPNEYLGNEVLNLCNRRICLIGCWINPRLTRRRFEA